VVRQGLKWSIGDGSKINVWRFPWLKDGNVSFVTSEMVAGYEELRVSDLMQQNERQWNEVLIH
jgi:hypothetical protein